MAASDDDQRAGGKRLGAATRLVHGGRSPAAQHGFVNPPVYRGSTVLFPTLDAIEAYDEQPYRYGRHGTPTTTALESALCDLEGGHRTVLTSSGYQAVTTALLAFVKAGDHILMVDSVYQPTRKFCDGMLAQLGVRTTYYDPAIGAGIVDLVEDSTKVIFTESPGSLTFEIQDIPAIVAVARAKGITTIIDNTWSAGHYLKPLSMGVDVSIQACTKYIVGHADAMLGAVIANERSARAIERSRLLLGICPGSEETFLALRGLRTLDVRLSRHHQSGLQVARWLEGRPHVLRVLHPGLESHPGHAIFKRDFSGASGLFSIVTKPCSRSQMAAMLDGLKLFGMGFSWGGFESLLIPFDPAPSRTATAWPKDGLAFRLHIGLEDVADLIADLEAAFERMAKAV